MDMPQENQELHEIVRAKNEKIAALQAEIGRLSKRDGNATIELCYNDGNDPFARESLKVVDFGVSDNGYVVESELVSALQSKLDKAVEVLEATGCGIESVLLANRLKRGDQEFLCGCLADVNTALKELKGE
jgi:hypothetical protein